MKKLIAATAATMVGFGLLVGAAPAAEAVTLCNDGWISPTAPHTSGACSSHGGVKDWYWNPETPSAASTSTLATVPQRWAFVATGGQPIVGDGWRCETFPMEKDLGAKTSSSPPVYQSPGGYDEFDCTFRARLGATQKQATSTWPFVSDAVMHSAHPWRVRTKSARIVKAPGGWYGEWTYTLLMPGYVTTK